MNPCPYGVDIPTKDELIASTNTIEEIQKFIGADGLFYAKVEDLVRSIRVGNRTLRHLCTGCFNGRYPTPEITKKLLLELGTQRNSTRDESVGMDDDESNRSLTLL